MVLALAPQRVVEDAERLERLVERARALARHLRERRGDLGKAALLGGGAVALGEAEHRLDGEARVLEELDALSIAVRAALREARVDLVEARAESVADRRTEVGRQVEDDAFLAERGPLRAARVHLGVGVQVGDLLHGPEEGEALAVHKRGCLGLQHLLEADARTRLVADAFGHEAVEERLPVHVAAKLRLLPVERAVQQALDSLSHFRFLLLFPPGYFSATSCRWESDISVVARTLYHSADGCGANDMSTICRRCGGRFRGCSRGAS